MEWNEVGRAVAKFAPALGTVLGGPLGTVAGGMIAAVFGADDDPESVAKAIERDPEAAVKLAEIDAEVKKHRASLALQAKQAELAARTAELTEGTRRMAEVNTTMRAELTAAVSGVGGYRTGWRPAFGWIMAASFGWIMFAIGYLLLEDPAQVAVAAQGVASLTTIWGVGLAVLGVAVWKRSDDKALGADPAKLTVLGAVAQRIAGSGEG